MKIFLVHHFLVDFSAASLSNSLYAKTGDPWAPKAPFLSTEASLTSTSSLGNSSSASLSSPPVAVVGGNSGYNPWEAATFHPSNPWLDVQTLQHHHNQVPHN